MQPAGRAVRCDEECREAGHCSRGDRRGGGRGGRRADRPDRRLLALPQGLPDDQRLSPEEQRAEGRNAFLNLLADRAPVRRGPRRLGVGVVRYPPGREADRLPVCQKRCARRASSMARRDCRHAGWVVDAAPGHRQRQRGGRRRGHGSSSKPPGGAQLPDGRVCPETRVTGRGTGVQTTGVQTQWAARCSPAHIFILPART